MNYVGIEPAPAGSDVDLPVEIRTHVSGLRTSRNALDASNDIDIAVGQIIDDTHSAFIKLGTPLTKRLDANWVAGNNNGGLDTAAKAANTMYALWLIRNSATGVVDAIFSTSYTSPVLSAGFDQKALIGSVRTDASSNILNYIQRGNKFFYITYITILGSGQAASQTSVNYLVAVPPVASSMHVFCRVGYSYPNTINAGIYAYMRVFSGQEFAFIHHLSTGNTGSAYSCMQVEFPVTGNLYYYRTPSGSVTNPELSMWVQGFTINRGDLEG